MLKTLSVGVAIVAVFFLRNRGTWLIVAYLVIRAAFLTQFQSCMLR